MSTPKKKLRPPAPRQTKDGRQVEVPPTTGATLTSQGDSVTVTKTRADFREEEFVKLIRQHGKFVIWRKALLCPCFNPESEQAVVNCGNCNGSGYLYVDPHQIQAVMMQFDKRTSVYEKFGLFQEGSCQVTTEAQYRLGYRDSLEMLDSVIPMNELLIKGDRRGRRRTLPAGVDSARFRIVSVARLIHQDQDGKIISLEEGQHYTITPEGWLRWTTVGDRVVPQRGVLSIHYDYHPIFITVSWMHVTRDDVSGRRTIKSKPRTVSHPVQAVAKLDFLVNVNGLPSLDAPLAAEPTGVGRET